MLNRTLKEQIALKLLPKVQKPGQYIGGELNAVLKDHQAVRGRLCLAFPDTYSIGMSHHGLQVLYHIMNRRHWACERSFVPWTDMEQLMRDEKIPLFSLETYTPLDRFDVLGFSLQYELGHSNLLTMLDLAGIPLAAEERTGDQPLVIAGGPCAHNPEPMSRFVDLFVIGDGEQVLPAVCDEWVRLKSAGCDRFGALHQMASQFSHVYVPRIGRAGRTGSAPTVDRGMITPAVVSDLDSVPLPTAPVVPNVECTQDRISLEIMRGCPWRCRFCQSNPIKRPVRIRRVDTIIDAAWEAYRNTGYNEISLLSLSTSDYPHFDELLGRMQDTFRPLGVSISVPSLRVNEQLESVSGLVNTDRRSGLTLAPEAARYDMRKQIGKQVSDHDLYEGCRRAFERGFQRVKLYFMCGLPGEREEDLRGIMEMAEDISRLGKQVSGRPVTVVASVSNFVPKPHTPFQWNAMQHRDYFEAAHRLLKRRRRSRGVQVKCHDIDASLLEGIMARGDERLGAVVERAWSQGARLDAWSEKFQPELWWQAIADEGIDPEPILHRPLPIETELPWDHIGVRQGRGYLEREQSRSLTQLKQRPCEC